MASPRSDGARHAPMTLGVLLLSGAVASGQQTTELVSVDSSGNQANGSSSNPSLSADSRYVAFESTASNLVPGHTGFWDDIFVHDRLSGITEIVSVNTAGAQANGQSHFPSISADGRYVAFQSIATNLGHTLNGNNVYVHDRQTGVTELISDGIPGDEEETNSGSPRISADGRYVVFNSSASTLVPGDTNGEFDVFVRDRVTGVTELVSVGLSGVPGNAASNMTYFAPAISADGRYVTFSSSADNLVTGDVNGHHDAFVRDRQAGVTELVSVDSSGTQADEASEYPAISADGRHVAFEALASNLVPGDTNSDWDVFVHDRQTGITERVSVDSSGGQAVVVSPGFSSNSAGISGDGRYAVFQSYCANLVPGDTNGKEDIFVHDRQTGVTERVSVDSSGIQGNASSSSAFISPDGQSVAFASSASNLAPDTNGVKDVFLRDRSCSADLASYCTAGTSASGCLASLAASGTASSNAPSGFVVSAHSVEGQKDGLFFFGQNGRQANSWGNGTSYQCVVPPVQRGTLLSGTGTLGACDGVLSQDLNALWCPSCPKPGAAPLPSQWLQIQLWYRDPSNTSNQPTSLSDAIEVMVCPGS